MNAFAKTSIDAGSLATLAFNDGAADDADGFDIAASCANSIEGAACKWQDHCGAMPSDATQAAATLILTARVEHELTVRAEQRDADHANDNRVYRHEYDSERRGAWSV